MSITYIAFIECVFRPSDQWQKKTGREMHVSISDKAEIALVDIKNDRRYFRAINPNTEVSIVSNTVVFDGRLFEEFSVDESVQFPKKKRIDE